MKKLIIWELLIFIPIFCYGQLPMQHPSDITMSLIIKDSVNQKKYLEKHAITFVLAGIRYVFDQEPKHTNTDKIYGIKEDKPYDYVSDWIKSRNLYLYRYINNEWVLGNDNALLTSIDNGRTVIDFKDHTSVDGGNARVFYLKENFVLVCFIYTENVLQHFYTYPIFLLFNATANLNKYADCVIFEPQRVNGRAAISASGSGNDFVIKMNDKSQVNVKFHDVKVSFTDIIKLPDGTFSTAYADSDLMLLKEMR